MTPLHGHSPAYNECKTDVYIAVRGVDLRDDAQLTRWRLHGLPIVERWCKADLTLMYLQGPEDGWFVDDHEDDYEQVYLWRPALAEMLGLEDPRDAWFGSDDIGFVAINSGLFKRVYGGHTKLLQSFDLSIKVEVTFSKADDCFDLRVGRSFF